MSDVNRATWSQVETLAEFSTLEGWINAGERASLLAVADRVRGAPALDVGVGTGRTVPLLRLLTDDYRAVDYTPAMVEVSRRRYPGLDIRLGDARDLADIGDRSMGFVLFSCNGLDAVGHDDRRRALAELHRVLRPGGWMVVSTHNQDGPSHRMVPWRGSPFDGPRWYALVRWLGRLSLNAGHYRRSWEHWWHNRRLDVTGDGWSIRASGAHDFGVVLHFVTLSALLAELDAAGFGAIEVYGSERGERLQVGDDVSSVHAFHVVAQRRLEA